MSIPSESSFLQNEVQILNAKPHYTSILVGHFVSSPREREKRDRRDSSDEREGQGRKRNRNETEETEEIKIFPPLPLPATRIAALAQLEANISWTPVDVRYPTPLPHPTTPKYYVDTTSYLDSLKRIHTLTNSRQFSCRTTHMVRYTVQYTE